ncbi:PTS system, mannose-specific IIB component [Clostridium cavendishii DSM 21758]|uniref:PTS system, mannose-specific IIB component n=1 Tax=Clostridium cavendishii DSM 21758 TaxID=1121302 RepID=A0A1M6US10_9CLOT|nr:PTS sugar transporter subunit IIB [Clostridium cavendishii]SHK71963.1 PTS system, mannose-specific IIB component [Clostridium cavendishii DSM 21758]
MKGIVHVRIDDRLIHGQVACIWSTSLGVNRIMVANDEVANNEMQKNVLRMVAPAGINTSIISKDKAVNNILAGNYQTQKVLMILKNPLDALYLIEHGLDIKEINVGNMAKRDNTVQIKRSVSVTKEEAAAFRKLIDKGVKITSIMVPDESKTYIKDYLDKAGL